LGWHLCLAQSFLATATCGVIPIISSFIEGLSMKKRLFVLIERFRSLERNEKTYWMGLLMLFVGLAWFASISIALIVVGAGMAIESVITSYLAVWFGSRVEKERP
jgi:hypothetical protein